MKLTKDQLLFIADDINSVQKKQLRKEDYQRFLMYEGKSKEIIEEAIHKEFKSKNSIQELMNRLVPLNITQKIINKLGAVYNEDPIRKDTENDEMNNNLIQEIEHCTDMNIMCKEGNRYFKLYRRNLEGIYLDDKGCPAIRNHPRHTYEVYSFNKKQPNKIDVVAIILKNDNDPSKQEIAVWSDESHIVINGKGEPIVDKMLAVGNDKGENPFKVLPFVYNNGVTYGINPLSDDDLLRMSIVIPLLLTDLLFACKYQAWALIYTVGFDGEIEFAPNSVVNVDFTKEGNAPSIETVKPDIDSDKVIGIVENLISYLLSTKDLSTASIIGKSTDVVSGVSKMLDSAESVENKKDQQAYFLRTEKARFDIIAHYLYPYWQQNNMLNERFNGMRFSEDFEVSVIFKEPTAYISEEKRLELSEKRLNAGLSTLKRELKNLHPYMSEDELFELEKEIREERGLNVGELQSDISDKPE